MNIDSVKLTSKQQKKIPFIRVSLVGGDIITQGKAYHHKVTYTKLINGVEEIKIIEQPLLSVDNIHFFNPLSKKIIITEADGGEYKPLTSIPPTTKC